LHSEAISKGEGHERREKDKKLYQAIPMASIPFWGEENPERKERDKRKNCCIIAGSGGKGEFQSKRQLSGSPHWAFASPVGGATGGALTFFCYPFANRAASREKSS